MKNVEDLYPLSPLQQGMLFHTLFDRESGAYIIQYTTTLTGELDRRAFRATWERVVERHTILRSRFVWEGIREPHQVVSRTVSLPWRELDWRDLDEGEEGRRWEALLEEEQGKGFDLLEAPLMRFFLVRTGERRYRFLWTYHHLLLDGWSVSQVLQEAFAIYAAEATGVRLELPPAKPFRVYVDWLQSRDLGEAETFWRRRFEGFPGASPLPLEPWAKDGRQGYGEEKRTLSAELSGALAELARRHRLTANTCVLGAWGLLLARYLGERDVTVGVVVAGRPTELPGVEAMVGPFINTLPMRLRIDPRQPVRSWLRELQEQGSARQRFEFSPLKEIQKWAEAAPGSSMFETLFVFENYPAAQVGEGPELDLEVAAATQTEHTNYPLTVTAELSGQLTLRASYDTARLDPGSARRLLRHLENVLADIAGEAERALGEVGILETEERRQILFGWNATARDFPRDHRLHRLIEEQAAKTPRAPAVSFRGETLSYRELDGRAARLAEELRSRGAGRDRPVAVFIDRSLELMVTLLAVLKAGAAYLPLSPEHPPSRRRFMLEDAGVELLITHEPLAEELGEARAATTLRVDARGLAGEGASADEGSEPLISSREVSSQDLAYVLYTSGSTGKPKAVMVPHGAIANRLLWMQEAYHLTERDRVLQKTPTTFDVSVWELFWPLMTGAHQILLPPDAHRDPKALVEEIARQGVTVLHFVPSMLRPFLQEPDVGRCASLRLVVCSGEALPVDLRDRFFARLDARLENLYGPTEAAVDVTSRRCRPGEPGRSVPIGRPISNLRVHVLDERMEPVPPEVPGELWIGGVGLARGYLGRPALTARTFLPDPFAGDSAVQDPGRRLYRTGDRVRYLEGGEIEFLGRVDHQVKVRGQRIELGEIEAALREHPGVEDAVVVVGAGGSGQRLVAYTVASQAPEALGLNVDELRRHLKETLPEYMVPAVFEDLDALPLNTSGKVDRKALPEPRGDRPKLAQEWVAPATDREEALAEIWSEVLGVEKVGAEDNFFSLGGDSILSLQVVSKAGDRDLPLSLPDLFAHQTVRELAASLEAGGGREAHRLIEPFALISAKDREGLPEDVEDAFPLAALQAGMLFHGEYQRAAGIYHNTNSVRLEAPLSLPKMEEALADLARRHPALRTSFELSRTSEPLQLVHEEARIPLVFEDHRGRSSEDQEAALAASLRQERETPFVWETPPLLRFRVHQWRDEEFQLTWSEHHAIVDGWSVAAMITELSRHYFSLVAGDEKPTDLVAPVSQYRDFVALERACLASDETREFWAGALEGFSPTELPTWPTLDRGEPSSLGHLDVEIPPSVSARLQTLAKELGVPLKSVLLAAHLRVLSYASGEEDLLTGLVSHGRLEAPDADRVLGLFLNTLPLTLYCGGGSWKALVRQIFEAENALLPHRRMPLAELQRRHGGGRPLFDIIFTYMHFHVNTSFEQSDQVQVKESLATIPTNFGLATYFNLEPFSGSLQLFFDYDPSRLHPEQVAALGRYYVRALELLAEAPERPYEAVPLLSDGERRQVLEAWGRGERIVYPDGASTLQELFEAQVDKTPDAPALTFGERTLSYRELDEAANRLAESLRRRGAGPGDRVALLLERSLELMVALYGVVKCGAAYLPLEPSNPPEHLAFALADAAPALLLTTSALRGACTEHSVPEVLVDGAADPPEGPPCPRPSTLAGPWDPAYVIYTSGSTGRPKAVVVPHRGIVNRLLWMQDAYRLTEKDCVLQKTPYTFDVSVWELFWPLQTGARLVVAPPGGHRDPALLVDLIVREGVTVLHFVPSLLRLFLRQPGLEACTSLRLVICSGEALPLDLTEEFFRSLGAELHNLYGPTEAAVDVTAWHCRPDGRGLVPIGTPIANVEIRVLEDSLEPAPVAGAGDLYIGGVALAQGYLHRPARTAATFLPDPFAETPGARLYRTGDRARFLPDGAVEFLGRADFQVKVRGLRIEPGEIEARLGEHPEVRQALVTARRDGGEDLRLVAYLVAEAPAAPAGEAAELAAEQVEDWRSVFDRTYGEAEGAAADPGFEFQGWVSTYTGEPIPAQEMRVWADSTVERILALHPSRVLEIGCGTGLLLLPVAPRCEEYVATDFSPSVITALGKEVAARGLDGVRLLCRPAEDMGDLPEQHFDLVVLNSVVQYFPDVGYLERVIAGALKRIRPGGHLLLGDLRSLPHLETFHTAAELERAPGSLSVAETRQRITARAVDETELVLAPEIFAALRQSLGGISEIRVQLRRGAARNELTEFRYDALLQVGDPAAPAAPVAEVPWIGWGELAEEGLQGIARRLETERPERLAVRDLPNDRLLTRIEARRRLARAGGEQTVAEIRAAARGHGEGVDPEALWQLGEERGFRTSVGWAASGDGSRMDVLFERADAALPPAGDFGFPAPPAEGFSEDPARYAGKPLESRRRQHLAEQLRKHLLKTLPEYMVPGAFVFLEAFPLTGSGKLARNLLPAPADLRPALTKGYVAPRTGTEKKLVAMLEEILGLSRVGVEDGFFALGGHSLSALQLIARIRDAWSIDLPLSTLHEAPTVALLASAILERQIEETEDGVLDELLEEVEELDDEELQALAAEIGEVKG